VSCEGWVQWLWKKEKWKMGRRTMNGVAGYGGMGRWMMIGGDLVVICGDWWWLRVSLDFSEGGRRDSWFVVCGKDV
jgi:hypothetical protein